MSQTCGAGHGYGASFHQQIGVVNRAQEMDRISNTGT